MPFAVRKLLAAISFPMFFGMGLLFGLLVFPALRLISGSKARHRRWCTALLAKSYPWFCFWMHRSGLLDYRPLALPPDLPLGRPYLLIANHPTLIDVLFPLGWFAGLTCVVKAAWFRSPLLRWLLRSTHYIPGPGLPGDAEGFGEVDVPPALERMVRQLEAGHPLYVFPEGTRSPSGGLGRFQRGPFEAAVRAKALLLPMLIEVSPPGLNKEVPLVRGRMDYTFSWLPWVDCAVGMPDPKELRRAFEARYAAALGLDEGRRQRPDAVDRPSTDHG